MERLRFGPMGWQIGHARMIAQCHPSPEVQRRGATSADRAYSSFPRGEPCGRTLRSGRRWRARARHARPASPPETCIRQRQLSSRRLRQPPASANAAPVQGSRRLHACDDTVRSRAAPGLPARTSFPPSQIPIRWLQVPFRSLAGSRGSVCPSRVQQSCRTGFWAGGQSPWERCPQSNSALSAATMPLVQTSRRICPFSTEAAFGEESVPEGGVHSGLTG